MASGEQIPQPPLYTESVKSIKIRLGALLQIKDGQLHLNRNPVLAPFGIMIGEGAYEVISVLGGGTSAVAWLVQSLSSSLFFALRAEIVLGHDAQNLIENSVDLTSRLGFLEVGPKVHFMDLTVEAIADTHLLLTLLEPGQNIPKDLNINKAMRIARSVQQLLDRMMSAGIYCVDIKPGNSILLVNSDQVRLIDFDYSWCSEVSQGKAQGRLTPNEQHDVGLLLLMQYILLLSDQHMKPREGQKFLRKAFAELRYPRMMRDIISLYDSNNLVRGLNLILTHYNPQTFSSLPNFILQLILVLVPSEFKKRLESASAKTLLEPFLK